MQGNISFKANTASPESDSIKLLQISRLVNVGTGTDYDWNTTDPLEAVNRHQARTTTAPRVTVGYFVDTYHKNLTARANKTDASVSPYYIDPAPYNPGDQEGYHKRLKSGYHDIKPAKLHDEPSAEVPATFKYETAARDTIGGHTYGVVEWGFEVTDIAHKTVTNEYANLTVGVSNTFVAAVNKFDELYKNPGSVAGNLLP